MSAQTSGIQLHLPARSENVALVRHALAGAARAMGMTDEVIADLKTVVTEACMNVVLHAYEEQPGPLEVRAWRDQQEYVVTVRDFGTGIRPRPDTERGSLRLGLSLIAAMTSGFQISGGTGRGTTITMRLSLSEAEPVATPAPPELNQDAEMIVLTAWDSESLAPILARVVSVLAARRDVGVDALSDAVLFSDVLSADLARIGPEETVRLSLADGDGSIDLEVGPLRQGMAEELRDGLYLPEELGGSLETLADGVETRQDEEGEFLEVRFATVAV